MDTPIKLMPYIKIYHFWKFVFIKWMSNITQVDKFIILAKKSDQYMFNIVGVAKFKKYSITKIYSYFYFNQKNYTKFKVRCQTIYSNESYDSESVSIS